MEVEALLYYNRPNPCWTLTKQQESYITRAIKQLQFSSTESSKTLVPPLYGFTGFKIKTADKNYYIYREKVECTTDNTYGFDNTRGIETYLVGTSPVRVRDYLAFF